MKLMQPMMTVSAKKENDFLYEIKYDGFRVRLVWTENEVKIISRKNINLTANFPEIVHRCHSIYSAIHDLLPMQLDGELVVLNNAYAANFSRIQIRGRLKSDTNIKAHAVNRHATFIAFDILQLKGQSLRNEVLLQRKKQLAAVFNKIADTTYLRHIRTYATYEEISKVAFDYKSEGIIAKRKTSTYQTGKNHFDWLKEKNWRTIYAFLITYNVQNDYFTTAVYKDEQVLSIGTCKHGLNNEEDESLKRFFMANGIKQRNVYSLQPAICISIHTLGFDGHELREPKFSELLPQLTPVECTVEKLQIDLAMLPDIRLSNKNKVFWPNDQLTKANLLIYMREIYPYMIPYVRDRALTVIRCPDGIDKQSFFQKNLPLYAPNYVDVIETGDKRIQICNTLKSLIWFANHGAIEYHIPYERVKSTCPNEIVFDLDPPTRDKFSLAVEAALVIKQLLDQLELTSFIKTSGNRGLQIHLPIIERAMSYEETAIFTEAIAKTVERMNPTMFTTERYKKNRKNKLYIDYVQHGKKRTIIAPYSPRKTKEATVATPLYWEEVTESLHPTQFTIKNVLERVESIGCPWLNEYELARQQKLTHLLKMIHK